MHEAPITELPKDNSGGALENNIQVIGETKEMRERPDHDSVEHCKKNEIDTVSLAEELDWRQKSRCI